MARDDPGKRRIDAGQAAGFLLLAAIWGSTWLVIKGQLGAVPPSWSVAYRFLLGGAVLFGWCLATGRPLRLPVRGHLFALVVGFLQFVLNFNFVYRAELYLASGLVALIYTMLVVANAGLAWLALRQRVTGRFVVGSVMGIAGVALLVGRDIGGDNVGLGLILAVSGLLTASVANILQATAIGRAQPLETGVAYAMLYGGLINSGFALATVGAPLFDARPEYWLGLAYLGIVASAVAFLIYYTLIRRLGAARAGYVNVVVPVLAMAASTLFEHYVWTPAAALGVVLALAGLVVALRSGV